MRVLCRVLEVSSSGFHAWLVRRPSARARFRERLKVAALAAHHRTRRTYGARRLQEELAADGFRVSFGTVKRVRRELGLRCVQREKRFRAVTTDSRHGPPVVPILLAQDFMLERSDEVWTADITYVATGEGWLYVAAIKGLFPGEVVGRSFGWGMTTDLGACALEQAVAARRPPEGLIHHSNRGHSIAARREYQALLENYGMRASMSRKGNCYHNAPVESFFDTLKTELERLTKVNGWRSSDRSARSRCARTPGACPPAARTGCASGRSGWATPASARPPTDACRAARYSLPRGARCAA